MTTTKDPDNELAAPQGCSVVEVMTLIPTDPQFWGLDRWPNIGEDYSNHPEYLRVKEAFTDIMIRRLAEVIPGVEDHIVWCEAATPMTQQRCTRSSGGTPYGLELSITQFGPFRPGVRTEIAGLYLCGASMAWGPAVEGRHAVGHARRRAPYSDATSTRRSARESYWGTSTIRPMTPQAGSRWRRRRTWPSGRRGGPRQRGPEGR